MNITSALQKLVVFSILLLYINVLSYSSNIDDFNNILKKAVGFKNRNNDSLIFYAQKAYLESQANSNDDEKLDALIVIIESKIRSGELLEALELCDTIKEISDKNNIMHRDADILLNIGNVYAAMGFAAEALDLFFEALKDENGNLSVKIKTDLYYYIAMVYYNIGEVDECRRYIDLSLKLALEGNYFKVVVPAYLIKSVIYNNADSINKYLELTDEILELNPNLKYEKAIVLNSKALLNEALGKYSKSNEQYNEAIRIARTNGFSKHMANFYNNYSYLLMAESNFDSAQNVLSESLQIAKEMNSADLQASIYDSYSDCFNAIGDYKNALLYQDSSIVKREQFRKEQQAQRSLYIAAVFETEQKEKAILEQENRITRLLLMLLGAVAIIIATVALVVWFRQRFMISRMKLDASEKGKELEVADALIKGQDSERKRLAMDLHDGLGAKMGSLRFLIDKNYHDTNSYDDLTSSLDDIKNNIRDLSHRMLPAQIEDLGLIYAIHGLIKSINKSDKFEVEFDTNVTGRLNDKLETNLYYLIFELINNATVHSKGNNIMVQLIEHDNRLNLSVEDDGGGFDINRIGSGSGMKNIRTRVEYLQGIYDIDAGENDTVVYIEIPKHD